MAKRTARRSTTKKTPRITKTSGPYKPTKAELARRAKSAKAQAEKWDKEWKAAVKAAHASGKEKSNVRRKR